MSSFRASPESTRLILLLMGAGAVLGVVLFGGTDPFQRLGLGILLLGPIIWASARLGVVERLTRAWGNKRYQRRFLKLRDQVDRLILPKVHRNVALPGAGDRQRGGRYRCEPARRRSSCDCILRPTRRVRIILSRPWIENSFSTGSARRGHSGPGWPTGCLELLQPKQSVTGPIPQIFGTCYITPPTRPTTRVTLSLNFGRACSRVVLTCWTRTWKAEQIGRIAQSDGEALRI